MAKINNHFDNEKTRCIRNRLQVELKGEINQPSPLQNNSTYTTDSFSRIDVLSDWELLILSNGSDWVTALGRITAYSYFYPTHRLRVHFVSNNFGNISKEELAKLFIWFGVKPTFESHYPE